MKKINIAIDGWSSCGKSTMARQLAKELNYIFIDSGAMYRAIALYFIQHRLDLNDHNAVEKALENIKLSFQKNIHTGNNEIWMNGENVEQRIREMEVASKVSDVAAIKEVREFAVAQQQLIGKDKGVVMDGRDIGTTVFPEAELKIFMTANVDVRVERRFKELSIKNPLISIEEVKANLQTRDHMDSTREVSPLKKANDALVLDNSELTPEEQFSMALRWANEKINA
ncbi:MAG: (d)CMP kinase [Chitinophagaceae bacterium]|jgi:cytidylate kinase|nr:(d)CMP kinase [Chitinophagaceae bacterium]